MEPDLRQQLIEILKEEARSMRTGYTDSTEEVVANLIERIVWKLEHY